MVNRWFPIRTIFLHLCLRIFHKCCIWFILGTRHWWTCSWFIIEPTYGIFLIKWILIRLWSILCHLKLISINIKFWVLIFGAKMARLSDFIWILHLKAWVHICDLTNINVIIGVWVGMHLVVKNLLFYLKISLLSF